MLRRFVRWLVGIPKRSSEDDDGGDDEDAGFAGSLLDASVNYAHGHKNGQDAVREMREINGQASKLRDVDDRQR
ncbi:MULTISPECIES: hypothetical protein [Halomicrobium]|uniref:Uncharacterized protein n=2 Tax=Halomicrobium mukohataei TaxID=57705 RepID=C7P3T0_HALMD|nr:MULTISPECIES: hypothetical protein [Halomicrobium]ACV47752.1 conserved hypothetical protein [Halomicrobium mukohataei DSM 12286]QCD66203.1 hypothetical protein E5139_11310 [Halomicrobium mukohataei]QFR21008.1 hypothetical protein GBQ70_11305 [Halomicrobium sp. ZPS1]